MYPRRNRLEFVELLDSLASSGKHAENIESDLQEIISDALVHKPLWGMLDNPPSRNGETYGLAQRSALSDSNLITLLNTESWRDMRSKVFVSLLVSSVLGYEVKVFSADD